MLRQHLVGDWHQAIDNGQVALMLTRRRADVADLNQRARRLLAETGYLDPSTETTVGGLHVCEGDWIVANRNRRSLGILNGDLGTVVSATSGALTVRLDRGLEVTLPADYVADHVRHGYALTIHKAQGATCDATFVLGDETLAQESAYTAMSRGKNTNHLYVMQHIDEPGGDERHQPAEQRQLDLVAALQRSEAKELAVDNTISIEL